MRPLLTLVSLLLLAGCASDAPEASGETAASAPASGEPAAAPEASGAGCLVGTWQIDPESMDPSKIPAIQEIPDADFSVGESTGRALLVFEASGDAEQRFEDFSLTINAAVMGQSMSVRNDYDGTARATYAIEGDRIVMTPGEAELSSSVSVNGGAATANPFATESVFEEWERGRTAFECDGDDLTLDIYAPGADGTDAFVRDVRYTRIAG